MKNFSEGLGIGTEFNYDSLLFSYMNIEGHGFGDGDFCAGNGQGAGYGDGSYINNWGEGYSTYENNYDYPYQLIQYWIE